MKNPTMSHLKSEIFDLNPRIEDIPLIFAPLEPMSTNPLLREIMGRNGARIVYRPKIIPTHLLKAKEWQYREKINKIDSIKTPNNLRIYDGIQIMARLNDPLKITLDFINHHSSEFGVQFIDLNFCCPGYKVRPTNRGGELLKKPLEIMRIIEKVLKHSNLPVSIKIRKGYYMKDDPFLLCKNIRKEFSSSIAWITINRAPVIMKNIDLDILENDLSSFQRAQDGLEHKIPLIANGSFHSYYQIKALINVNLAEGVMIGRSALGNQQIFRNIKKHNYKYGISIDKQELESQMTQNLTEFFELIQNNKDRSGGAWSNIGELKRQLYYYIKFYYEQLRKDIPAGLGYTKWRKGHFSKAEFIQNFKRAFPFLEINKIQKWLNYL